MSTEIELKLEIDPGDLPSVRDNPLLANAESRSSRQVTVYYDTPETKLKKHGFTLRVRSADGHFIQTVKPVTDSVGLLSREELECEVDSLAPDLSLLREHPIFACIDDSEADSLGELIRSEVERTIWLVDIGNGQVEVDLDHGTMVAGKRSTGFAELELELREGSPVTLVMAARRMSDYSPVRLGVLTKADRGFRLVKNEQAKVAKAGPVKVHARMRVGEAFDTVVHACLKHYRLNEPLVIEGSNPSALHQCRVAMRRLRSALTLFRPAVGDVEFQHLREELRWFTAQLGDARNLDVYLQRNLPKEERDRLLTEREAAYDHVREAMNSHKFRRLLIDLVGWCAIGAWRRGKLAQQTIASFATARLDRLWRTISAAGRRLAAMDEAERHRIRIQIKKLRYAVEFLEGIYVHVRTSERRFAAAVEELQESLGTLNDMTTARSFGAAPVEHEWLIGTPGERRHLVVAEQALRELLRTGPFWRSQEVAA